MGLFLTLFIWVFIPRLNCPAFLNQIIFLARIESARQRHEPRINDFPLARDESISIQARVEASEQRLDQIGLGQLLAHQPDCFEVGHPVVQRQTQKPYETKTVANLLLDGFVVEVVERLQDQHLEHKNGVERRPTCVPYR